MYDLTEEKISELHDLLEKIEKRDEEWNELAYNAKKFLYDNNLIIVFDWVKWDEGRDFFKEDDPNKYNNLDREYTLKLLTAVARNDRFCTGVWCNLFKSGTALKLFKRLLETYK